MHKIICYLYFSFFLIFYFDITSTLVLGVSGSPPCLPLLSSSLLPSSFLFGICLEWGRWLSFSGIDNLINIAFKNRHLCYYISSYNLLLLYVLYIWIIYMIYPSDILFICFSFCYMWGLAFIVKLASWRFT